MSTTESTPCVRCALPLPGGATFCPSCGWDQTRIYVSALTCIKRLPLILLSGGLIFTLVAAVQRIKPGLGTAPLKTQAEIMGTADSPQDEASLQRDLEEARKQADANRDDVTAWKNLAALQLQKLRQAPQPTAALIIDLISSYQEILRIDPKEPEALVGIADASLSSKVPDKAVQFYTRYLEVVPEDIEVRARLGSSLALLGKFQEAERELQSVLSKDKNNFSALAYLAVSAAKQGQREKALEYVSRAQGLMKSPEEKQEFARMFEEMLGNPHPASGAETTEKSNGPTHPVEQALRTNKIAGPKFVKFEASGSVLKAFLRDFPMQAMPPFARDKFLGSLKPLLKKGESLQFLDADSGKLLSEILADR